ncbi:MAG: DUF255 domain-containing protein [Methylophilaceae bacterium]
MYRLLSTVFFATLLGISLLKFSDVQAEETSKINCQPWSDAIFAQAKRENKLLILDLEAVWCHWCHVMDEKTYHDPAVVNLIQQNYIAIRVDQDANPDISIRYEEYGWPATIIFNANGEELVKRRGYIPPEPMANLLQAVIDDPTPGPSVAKKAEITLGTAIQFSNSQREKIISDINRGYDVALGGWGRVHKFILAPNTEYALIRAKQGDKAFEKKARETLDAAIVLIDPVWGGIYQYSDRGRWNSPHFEKIMSFQADDIRLYSLAFVQFKEARYLKAARDIERYLADFLTSPEGAFYTSQDADASKTIDGHAFYPLDDKGRRALGVMPRIDKNSYARENGWAIRGLAALYDATGDKVTLQRAIKAVSWVEQNRQLAGGGFKHGEQDRAGPYLGDTLAMTEAYVALYTSTGDRQWLSKAKAGLGFIEKKFTVDAGYASAVVSKGSTGVFQQALRQMEENVTMARVANQLFHYTGDTKYQKMAEHAMKYLVALVSPDNVRYLAGPLAAADELAADPAHIVIVGAKTDPAALALYQKALQYPVGYRRIEWWDKAEGALPNPDVQYPQLAKAAAFICVNQACSTPIFDPENIAKKADTLLFRVE